MPRPRESGPWTRPARRSSSSPPRATPPTATTPSRGLRLAAAASAASRARAVRISRTTRSAAREGRHVVGRETRQQRKDGTIVPVSLTLSAMADASGAIASVSAIVRDMTERHQAERSLRESEERFRLIAATVTQAFWIADVSLQTMLYISPGYERIWGRSCESLYRDPRSFLDAVHPDDRAGVMRTLERRQRGQRFDNEYRIVRPDGETRHIHDRGFPIARADGIVVEYVGVAEDITERLKAERAVIDAEERMRFALEASQI